MKRLCNKFEADIEFLGAFEKLGNAIISFLMSVCLSVCLLSAKNNSPSTRQIFVKFYIWSSLEILYRKLKYDWNPTRMTSILSEYPCAFMLLSRWILFKMRNVWQITWEKIKACILNLTTFSLIAFRLQDNLKKYYMTR